ncbi:CocE/NonD family hydrolase [Jatrophihabitans endophyticus]|uniref:CocE/NonD family hydrolase n=1 Tax=Jatrophihabitans endophyticus TaxID=1206085 RepID=UPI00116112D8|nr:CocE/NonD family hydrolase [Jatrophihabitans endophyticus]
MIGVLGVVVALVVALVLVVVLRDDRQDETDPAPTDAVKDAVPIAMSDGVTIRAQVTEPAARGRRPLVIMPTSYGANSTQYAVVAHQLSRAGFVTVAYTQRGFAPSGGSIDLAGPRTQQDARAVLDWSLRHTRADPAHVGMLGVSYGAGISLLTAAHDKRVRAVVAFSTWASLAQAFHPADTTSVLALNGLLSNERVTDQLRSLEDGLRTDPATYGDHFAALSPPRSPATFVDQLNANRPAIMLANGWQDSLFAPGMLVPFYRQLTTPKRLQLSVGDHTGPETDMLAGTRSRTGDAAYAWLLHYLGGAANGIDAQPPVQLEDVTTKTVQVYRDWPNAGGITNALAAPTPSGVAITQAPATWQASVRTGQDSAATAGLSQFVRAEAYRLPTARPASLPADRALVWSAGALTKPTRVLGSSRLTLSVASSSPRATLFVYLYDTAADGTASLMTLTPYTVSGLRADAAKPVTVDTEPIDWTLAAGHTLTVVVDTVEPRWNQVAPAGSTLTLSSSAATPARLTVPLG